jgi:peptide/nickel transport system permease protein
MKLITIIANRLAWLLPTVLGLVAITFLITHVVPSDPAALVAGDGATEEQVAVLRTELGYDRPLHEQFYSYMGSLAEGDLGTSLYTGRDIVSDLNQRLKATVELTLVAMFITVLVGIPLGVASALRRNKPFDHAVRILTVSGLAIASFWLAMMLQLLFAMSLDWLPLNGRVDGFPPRGGTGFLIIDTINAGRFDQLSNVLAHMVLPVATLAIPATATVVRFVRAGVLEAMQKNFVLYETAMGFPQSVITWKYILRNALISTVTQVGLIFGIMLAGAVVVETVFDWPGIGSYAYKAIVLSDYNAIMAFTLWAGVIFIVVNMLVDVLHTVIDPRT